MHLIFAPFSLLELRRASANPTFFTEAHRDEQYQWAEHLAERVIWPGADVPAVCLFDTGVNRAHALIEPTLSVGDLLTARGLVARATANWTNNSLNPVDHVFYVVSFPLPIYKAPSCKDFK